MPLDLAGVNAKLDRASAHWRDLYTPGRAGPLYPRVTLREVPGSPVQWVVDTLTPISPAFAPTLGDCLHNYRSALDHLVAAVRAAEGHGENRTSQWPVLQSWEDWSRKESRDLAGLPQSVIDLIRDEQPDRSPAGDLDVLLALSELDNTDKHRRLNVVTVHGKALGTTNLSMGSGGVKWNSGPMEIGSVVVEHPPVPLQPGMTPPSADLTAEIALKEAGREWRIGELMWFVDKRVREVVVKVADAYGGVAQPYFTGPPGPSGYPGKETNMLDPTGHLMGMDG